MKIFLSYSIYDKVQAGQIKNALEKYGLEVFLAHEDIEPSAEWVDTILAELKGCDLFIPILTDNFDNSDWTDQETGIAFAHKKSMLPIKMKKDPHGFISRYQALSMDEDIESAITSLIHVIVSRYGNLFRDALIKKFGNSENYSETKKNLELILSFNGYSLIQINDIIKYTIANDQIWGYGRVGRLRNLILKYQRSIDPKLMQAFDKAISHSAAN